MIDEILAVLDPDTPVVLDVESTGLSPWTGDVIRDVQIGIGERIWHLPLTRPHSDNIPRADVVALLEKIAATQPLLVFANAKYDKSMILADLGVDLRPCPTWDVLTGAWLEDENNPHRDLKGRAAFLFPEIDATAEREGMRRLCDGPTLKTLEDALYAASRLFGARKVTRAQCNELARQRPEYGRREMWDLTAEEIHPYACRDIDLTTRLYHYQRSLMHLHSIEKAMPREMAVSRGLMGMEKTGILVDTARAERSHAQAVARLEELTNLFEGINPDSNPQLQTLVYEDWGFPVLAKTDSGAPSTAKATLELLGDDPRIVGLLEWRRLRKAVTAYYRPLLTHAGPDGRIHPSFKQHGTRTGRFSCESPNLQTIPREDTDSEVRALFRPAPGYALVGFDLAQAEVRWAAALSRDPGLVAACQSGDVYTDVARQMGVDRPHAKQTVLANNYGAGAEQLASILLKGTGRMITPADVRHAGDLQHRLRRAFPAMAAAADRLEQVARRDGRFPLHPPGRYRHFRGPGHAPEEYRKAWNSACQGGIGELMKDLMVALDEQGVWANYGARLLLQIHDELLAEVPTTPDGRASAMTIAFLKDDIQTALDDINPLPAVRQIVEVKLWGTNDRPSSTSSPVSEGSPSGSSGPGSAAPPTSRSTPTASGSSPSTGPTPPSSETSPPWTQLTFPGLTSSPEDSPASPSRRRVSAGDSRTNAGSGLTSPVLFGSFGPDGFSSRTSRAFSRLPAAERRRLSSGIFPTSGMTAAGLCYRLPPLALPTFANESSLLPTPSASSYGTNHGGGMGRVGPVRPSLQTMARKDLWPTPTEADGKGGPGTSGREGGLNLRTAVGGSLNPTWIEWLQGFPIGWTDLEPSETPSSPSAPSSSVGGSSPEAGNGG